MSDIHQRKEQAIATCEANNCELIESTDTTLLCDLDDTESTDAFEARLDLLEELDLFGSGGSVDRVEKWRSRSGTGWHVLVTLSAPLSAERRVFLQALLGSDPKREALSLARIEGGMAAQDSILLFRPRGGVITEVRNNTKLKEDLF